MIVSVVDYGVANIGSLMNMLDHVGVAAARVSDPEKIVRADRLILPGVGSFDAGMSALGAVGLDSAIQTAVRRHGVPILGICLGMQLLGEGSEEGVAKGLGLLDARSVRLGIPPESGLRIPHQGWAPVVSRGSSLIEPDAPRRRFYFSHSFHLVCSDETDVSATARYGTQFAAMVERGHVFGAQFHPEKSHSFGMDLLRRYGQS